MLIKHKDKRVRNRAYQLSHRYIAEYVVASYKKNWEKKPAIEEDPKVRHTFLGLPITGDFILELISNGLNKKQPLQIKSYAEAMITLLHQVAIYLEKPWEQFRELFIENITLLQFKTPENLALCKFLFSILRGKLREKKNLFISFSKQIIPLQ